MAFSVSFPAFESFQASEMDGYPKESQAFVIPLSVPSHQSSTSPKPLKPCKDSE
jgi:hypothetical protein